LFLKFLQEAYPPTFSTLKIFQEGQFFNDFKSAPLPRFAPQTNSTEVDNLILQSQADWYSARYYPLNQTLEVGNTAALIKTIGDATKTSTIIPQLNGASSTNIQKFLSFYNTTNPDGSINITSATLKILGESPTPNSVLIDRLRNLKPRDANFAKYLINQAGFRGALAYELYATGNMSGDAHSSKVSVYGIDDPGIYLTSCFLERNCAPSIGVTPKGTINDWVAIQPYRDWLMAKAVLQSLHTDKSGAVPIVLASVSAHLPLVREVLCREGGVNTITLDYTSDSAALSQFFTTQVMEFLRQTFFDVSTLGPPNELPAARNSQAFTQVMDAFAKAR